jgi:amino acid transporter
MSVHRAPIAKQDSATGAPANAPGVAALTATGAGTAMASVCAIGLLAIEELVGGLWSVAAVLIAGLVCAWLARVFARLASVIPSGASLLAYAVRGLGRRTGMLLVLPYFLAMLLLAGFEAIVVGELSACIVPLPPLVGAALFLLGAWAICRAGVRIGYRAQAGATLALFALLVCVSLAQLFQAAELGLLHERLLPPAPHPGAFLAAVGQALFLFMGFELVAAHAEVARPGSVAAALRASVVLLTVFYATLALGLSSMPDLPAGSDAFVIPQLAIASQVAVPGIVVAVAVVCMLASFTSYNGALLGLSRLTYALAKQGMLSRKLAVLHPRTLTARPALNALLAITLVSSALIHRFALYLPVIFAAAAAAALLYATMAFIREREPFLEPDRRGFARAIGASLALLLVGLAICVMTGADDARRALAVVLLALLSASAWGARGMNRRLPPPPAAQASHARPLLSRTRSR